MKDGRRRRQAKQARRDAACVDFSAVKGGTLTAYRWSGEEQIRGENYVP
ncbi:hypothetical protein ABQE93_10755 [Mycolicibacterium sp. XJ662]